MVPFRLDTIRMTVTKIAVKIASMTTALMSVMPLRAW